MSKEKHIFLLPLCSLQSRLKAEDLTARVSGILSKRVKTYVHLTVCTPDGVPRLPQNERVLLLVVGRGVEDVIAEYWRVNRRVPTVILVLEKDGSLTSVLNAVGDLGLDWPILTGLDVEFVETALELQAGSLVSRDEIAVLIGENLDMVLKGYKEHSRKGSSPEEALTNVILSHFKGKKAVAVDPARLLHTVEIDIRSLFSRLDKHLTVVLRPDPRIAALRHALKGVGWAAMGLFIWLEGRVGEIEVYGDAARRGPASIVYALPHQIEVIDAEILSLKDGVMRVALEKLPRTGAVVVVSRRLGLILRGVQGVVERNILHI